MAKSAQRRHHAKRLLRKWSNELKHYSYMENCKALSFGKIYSKDPFDCGRADCGVCHLHKRFKTPRKVEKVPYHTGVEDLLSFY